MEYAVVGAPVSREELAALYSEMSARLRQIVGGNVRAPAPLVEDACQVAWSRLLRRSDSVRREAMLAWLVTTATREALRLLRRAEREVSLDDLTEPVTGASGGPAPDLVVELRSRLEGIGTLPQRQQRLIWLQGLGLSYTEMSAYTGASLRTVERQLLLAKRRLRST